MGPASRAMVAERRPRPMIGTVMPPKSPELAASVSEMELRVERAIWLSSTIMLGSAERMGAFTAAATHKSKPRVLCHASA